MIESEPLNQPEDAESRDELAAKLKRILVEPRFMSIRDAHMQGPNGPIDHPQKSEMESLMAAGPDDPGLLAYCRRQIAEEFSFRVRAVRRLKKRNDPNESESLAQEIARVNTINEAAHALRDLDGTPMPVPEPPPTDVSAEAAERARSLHAASVASAERERQEYDPRNHIINGLRRSLLLPALKAELAKQDLGAIANRPDRLREESASLAPEAKRLYDLSLLHLSDPRLTEYLADRLRIVVHDIVANHARLLREGRPRDDPQLVAIRSRLKELQQAARDLGISLEHQTAATVEAPPAAERFPTDQEIQTLIESMAGGNTVAIFDAIIDRYNIRRGLVDYAPAPTGQFFTIVSLPGGQRVLKWQRPGDDIRIAPMLLKRDPAEAARGINYLIQKALAAASG